MRAALLRKGQADLHAALTRLRKPGEATVHGARVAIRRLRAILRALRRDLHPVFYTAARFDLQFLGRSLGPLRDTAVRQQQLQSLSRSGKKADRKQLAALRAMNRDLAEVEHGLREGLLASSNSRAWKDRIARINAALNPSTVLMASADAGAATARRAERRVLLALADSLRTTRVTPHALHGVRLAVKRARYVCDAIDAARDTPQPIERDVLHLLRELQNLLGEINDLFQLKRWLAKTRAEPHLRRKIRKRLDLKLAAMLDRYRAQRKSAQRRLRKAAKAVRLRQQRG